MKYYLTLASGYNLDKVDLIDWLKREFRNSEFILGDVFQGDGIYATFYGNHDDYDSHLGDKNTYEFYIDDDDKASSFEHRWGWWVMEKWYIYDGNTDGLEDWYSCCIPPVNWKTYHNNVMFRHREDAEKALFVFGKRQPDAEVFSG